GSRMAKEDRRLYPQARRHEPQARRRIAQRPTSAHVKPAERKEKKMLWQAAPNVAPWVQYAMRMTKILSLALPLILAACGGSSTTNVAWKLEDLTPDQGVSLRIAEYKVPMG